MRNKLLIIILLIASFFLYFYSKKSADSNLPLVAIANYGPHSSLTDSIKGIKEELERQGFIENENIRYDIDDVSFDSNLIPQMVSKLKAKRPTVMIAMTTPVAQFAKHNVKDIPLIFNVITDPIEAKLLKKKNQIDGNSSCTSDAQDLDLLLNFAKKLLPNATRVGLLYSTAEANDIALVKMLEKACYTTGMSLFAVPVDQPRDVAIRMQSFKDKVDFIYVGTSGPIQPTLPVIVAEADKMNIPIFNVNEEAVQNNQVLASFGVNYIQIGKNTGNMVAHILKGGSLLPPIYPASEEHQGFISKKRADSYGIKIPSDLKNVNIVE